MKKIKYLSYAFRFATTGVFIGLVISFIYSYMENPNSLFYPSTFAFVRKFARPLDAVAVSALLWALMGLVFGFGSMVYFIKKWSYLKQTTTSFIIYYVGFTPLVILAGWFPLSWVNLIIFTAEFIVIFLIVWTFYYWKTAREIRRINQKIKKK
ncbi:DUF3021 domain-containing protein [Lactobacillus panisapium]|uniref:DUF3021 domain-containing protein n=1 Tax=Lactobacillus panisapium TaxID=2012495 RepID=UPI001C698C1D|nr:DUF3021 domain-containing protein [Lactobacillus panisapium]QYN58284.1 DUF3021 domain-containing protein [Lactobacillus panisapium]